jgi:uncharacterized protein DUF3108
MSRHLPARTVLAGAAGLVLAGCGASGSVGAPQVSMGVGHAASASAPASETAQGTSSGSGATSNSFAAASSIPFPVTVGDTWVYQTTTNVNGERGLTTDKIVSAGPAAAGYQVTMSETVDVGGAVITAQPVYLFYPSGKVAYPVTDANGVSVTGGGVTWPDADGLASGQAYHSVVRIRVSQAGASADQNADVTVQGTGTAGVTVPAGSYQATVVNMTITTQVGSVDVKTWLAPGTGPVKSEVVTHAAGKTDLTTTNVLLTFTKGAARTDGS